MFSWLGLGRQQEETVEEVTGTSGTSEEILDVSDVKIDDIQEEKVVIDNVVVETILAEPEPEPE